MRKIHKILVGLLCVPALIACGDLMDTHKEFIEGGEIIYAPKPDTIYFKAGKERVQLNYKITKAPNIKELQVTWNKGEAKRSFPLEMVNGNSEGVLYIDELTERAYSFEVKLIDSFGHSSLQTAGYGRAYGSVFQSTLRVRTITDMKATDDGGVIEWTPASSGVLYNEVKYINNQGQEAIAQVDSESAQLLLPDFRTGTGVEYRSVYIPEEGCADKFYTDWYTSEADGFIFPHTYSTSEQGINRSAWSTLLCESVREGDGQGVPGLFDGDRNTYWHSGYDDGRVECPYAMIFDMKEALWIGKIGLMQRNGGYNFRLTGVDFYISGDEQYAGSKDGNNWTLLVRTTPIGSDEMQWFDVPISVIEGLHKGRFLKMVIARTYDNNNGIAAMAELAIQRIVAVDGVPVE